MSPPYQYIVVHQSCKNHPGVLAVQAAHAAGESIRSLPVDPATIVCVLVASFSHELEQLSEALKDNFIPHVLIREPDAPYSGAATALGIAPMERERVREFVKQFAVLR